MFAPGAADQNLWRRPIRVTSCVFAPALPMNDPDEPISACTGVARPLIVLLPDAFWYAALTYTSVRFDKA